MCRLLGYISPEAVTTADLIGAEECRQWQNLGRLHADGWGTAWIRPTIDSFDSARPQGTTSGKFDTGTNTPAEEDTISRGGRLERYRTPHEGADDEHLTEVLTQRPSAGRIAHLRMATMGIDLVENTHPFLADNIAFAHNGSIHPIERLREYASETEIERIGGSTDSAIMFALILRRVAEGDDLLNATVATVRMIRSDFDHPGINLLVLTAEEMIVVHDTAGTPIPYQNFDTSGTDGELPLDHKDHYYRMSWQRFDDGATVVSSSGLDHKGWSLIEQSTAMRLSVVNGDETIVRL
ncbi:class II glutamine amidotransferase [Brevibacterium antiquum]|uniref:Predicted glutamine amidotransferase n=1 Tax=Brevibacterium antiquum TaxID=234835 RepID=A0A2H1II79_9MICO|nr:class II glutamine amidotransferase [Brevibacterium antiquum]SMX74816.1 Predicted glutamine amidotransferase [Brevibacterium antiquum]